jgi:hypothetical protein
MSRFDDLEPEMVDAAAAAFEAACRALDALSTASRPGMRQAYEAAIEAAIRKAAVSKERGAFMHAAIAAVVRGPSS